MRGAASAINLLPCYVVALFDAADTAVHESEAYLHTFLLCEVTQANTRTHPGMQQHKESRAFGYPIYMAFALDESRTELSDEVLESDGEGSYIVIDESGSSAEEEITDKLQNVGLTEEQEGTIPWGTK